MGGYRCEGEEEVKERVGWVGWSQAAVIKQLLLESACGLSADLSNPLATVSA